MSSNDFKRQNYENGSLTADQTLLLDALDTALGKADRQIKPTHATVIAQALIAGEDVKLSDLNPAMSYFRRAFPGGPARHAADRLKYAHRLQIQRQPGKRSRITDEDLTKAERHGVGVLLKLLMTVPLGKDGTQHDKNTRGGFLIICKAIAAARQPQNKSRVGYHWQRFASMVAHSPRAIEILDAFNDAANDGKIQPEHYGFKLKLAMTGSLALAVEARLKRVR